MNMKRSEFVLGALSVTFLKKPLVILNSAVEDFDIAA